MSFEPINDDHAIDTVAFSVFFVAPLSAGAINALMMNKAAWVDDLPHERRDTIQSFDMSQGGAGVGRIQELPAVEYSYLRPDGRPVWALKTDISSISVLNTTYTRWEKVWPKSERILRAALGAMSAYKNLPAVSEITFEVRDAFVCKNVDYDIASLINLEAEEIASFCEKAGALWHQHTGWFQELDEDYTVLNQLNIDSVDARGLRQEERNIVSIKHMQRLRPAVPLTLNQILDADKLKLEEQIISLHGRNKELLNKLLTADMANRIGLRD
ncbi:TIGR04255 family protein [Labrenzia sp. ac12]